jgi:DNA-binding NarL/FixJ family response regulator
MSAERSTANPIKVLLADDHTLFRQGLASVLASYGGIEIVAETTNDQEAIELARLEKPDVVVMQVQMPFDRAKHSLEQLRMASPALKIVICTMFEDPTYLRTFLELGVSTYLVKSVSAEELVGVIRAAVFDPKGNNVVVGMPQEMIERAQGGSDGVLSAKETETLVLAARGLSNRQIASSLGISVATIKRHLSNAYPKMGVSSRGEAVRSALQEGWIPIQEITQERLARRSCQRLMK